MYWRGLSFVVLLLPQVAWPAYPLFQAPFQQFDAGANLFCMSGGDFNGDGRQDFVAGALIEGGFDRGGLTVWLGSPGGGFASSPSPAANGASVWSVTTGDFNADGRADIVAGFLSASPGSVQLFLANGTGFDAGLSVAGAQYPVLEAGHFDTDGKLDLATRNSVLHGTGTGTFGTPWPYPAGVNVQAVKAADLNEDGFQDLLLADLYLSPAYDGEVVVLLGQADGSFTEGIHVPVGQFPYDIDCGDLNGDGHVDAAVANFYSSSVSVLLGHGDGTLTAAPVLPAGAYPQGVCIGDVTGTPSPDIAVGHFCRPFVRVCAGRGDGTFLSGADLECGDDVVGLAVHDVDQDGRNDLVAAYSGCHGSTATFNGGGLAVLLRRPDGGLGLPPLKPGRFPFVSVAAPLDADNRPDLAVANEGARSVTLFHGAPGGTFTPWTTLPAGGVPYGLVAGDWNRDGRRDLAMGMIAPASVRVQLNNGNGTFAAAQTVAVDIILRSMQSADLDRDGNQDLILGNTGTAAVTVLWGDGKGGFPRRTDYPVGTSPQQVAVGDLNGDRRPDVAAACTGSDAVSIWFSDPLANTGGLVRRLDLAAGDGPRALAMGNLDRDPWPDLAIANGIAGTVSVYLGRGHETFDRLPDFTAGLAPAAIVMQDLDGDKQADLMLAEGDRYECALFHGRGDGTFCPGPQVGTGRGPRAMTAADLDMDGDIDLVVCNVVSDDVTVLLAGVYSATPPVVTLDGAPPRPEHRAIVAGSQVHVEWPGAAGTAWRVSVFDVAGRRVRDFVPQEGHGAANAIRWDVSSVPGGVYLLRMQSGNQAIIRRVVVLH